MQVTEEYRLVNNLATKTTSVVYLWLGIKKVLFMFLRRVAEFTAVLLIRFYQTLISPLILNRCRFYPSCSQYAIDAIKTHGMMRGSYFAIKRFLRCNPFGSWGYDPVPKFSVREPKKKCRGGLKYCSNSHRTDIKN